MNGKALTDGEYRELVGCLVEGIPSREEMVSEAIRAHLGAKAVSHEALKLMLGMEPQRAIELLATIPVAPAVISAPAGLMSLLESQADRLIDIGAFSEVKVSRGKYHDELMAAARAFVWKSELAAIGLTVVVLIDYRLSSQFLAEAGSVYCYIAPDNCKNFEGVATPNGVLGIQMQRGEKYRNKKPVWCRSNFHILEQGGVVKEGLTAFLYGGVELLKKCYMDLPGSVSEYGYVPYLYWLVGMPQLGDGFGDGADPRYGSVSRGK